jgi:hypothetical protein
MQYIGLILILLGITTTLGNFGDVAAMLLGGAMTFVGSIVYNRNRGALSNNRNDTLPPPKKNFAITDEMIARLARHLGGRLTVDELSQQTSLTRDQAKERLEALHRQGICQINLDQVEESGKIYYYF